MNAALILIIGIVILFIGYVTYGKWLTEKWGLDEKHITPSHELEDGLDYVPAKAPVLLGHHFSSIAGAGPINGPIQVAVFGWIPVVLWILIGGILFGATHDFGALLASIRHKGQSIGKVIGQNIGSRAKKLFIIFSYLTLLLFGATHDFGALLASIRHKGQSIGKVIGQNIGSRAKKLFIIFSYLTLLLVVAAFASIVADTFKATFTDAGAIDYAASATNASTAMISLLFIVVAVGFGFFVYRRNASLGVSTVIGVISIIICIAIGINYHPIYLSSNAWMIIIGIYILVASVTPVWILLQPRDYLSSFLLYGMMAIAVVGILGSHPTLDIPVFTGFVDTVAPTGTSIGYLFPALFVTIACGAMLVECALALIAVCDIPVFTGFVDTVAPTGTSIGYLFPALFVTIACGAMLVECALALIAVCAVGYIRKDYSAGTTVTPTIVFATGIASMLSKIPGLSGVYSTAYSLLVLTVSVFCLT